MLTADRPTTNGRTEEMQLSRRLGGLPTALGHLIHQCIPRFATTGAFVITSCRFEGKPR